MQQKIQRPIAKEAPVDEKRVEAAAAALMARLHASDYTYALTIEDAQDMATIVLDAFFSAEYASLSYDMRISLSHAIDSRFRTLDSTRYPCCARKAWLHE